MRRGSQDWFSCLEAQADSTTPSTYRTQTPQKYSLMLSLHSRRIAVGLFCDCICVERNSHAQPPSTNFFKTGGKPAKQGKWLSISECSGAKCLWQGIWPWPQIKNPWIAKILQSCLRPFFFFFFNVGKGKGIDRKESTGGKLSEYNFTWSEETRKLS